MRFKGPESVGAKNAADGWVQVEDRSLPRPIMIRLRPGRDGRLVCTGLRIDSERDRELTARNLRDIPLASILTEAARRAKSMGYNPAAKVVSNLPVASAARPGRRGYPDQHYRQVARAYQQAKRRKPRAPIRELANKLHVSEPTVHRWLREARKRGFLKGEKR